MKPQKYKPLHFSNADVYYTVVQVIEACIAAGEADLRFLHSTHKHCQPQRSVVSVTASSYNSESKVTIEKILVL